MIGVEWEAGGRERHLLGVRVDVCICSAIYTISNLGLLSPAFVLISLPWGTF